MAFPAAVGFRERRNCFSEPVEVTNDGRCGVPEDLGGEEQSIHSSQSMSWHDLVRRDGAVVSSRRQLPLQAFGQNLTGKSLDC